MEQNVPESIRQGQEDNKKGVCMKFYYTSRPLYQKTDASGVSHGAHLLQVKEGMNCKHDKVLDNVTSSICICQQNLLSMV